MREATNGYFIDPEEAAETVRLIDQATTVSRLVGRKPFFESVAPDTFRTVLDIACGPGDWVMEVAYQYPHVEALGVDISGLTIEYARARARTQGLKNALFTVGDVTRPLEYPAGDFDYIHGRFLVAFLRRQQWPLLIEQCRHVLKPGGSICLMEGEWPISNSLAYQKYTRFLSQAFKRAGLGFSVDGFDLAITHVLSKFLRDAGFTVIEQRAQSVELSYGMAEYINWFTNCRSLFLLAQPFMLTRLPDITPEELDTLYDQALIEMQQEDFCSLGTSLAILARKATE